MAAFPMRQNVRGVVHAHTHFEVRTVIHLVMQRSISQPIDHAPHTFFRIRHHMSHVGADSRPSIAGDQQIQFANPGFIGGELGFDVRERNNRPCQRATILYVVMAR